MSSSWDPDGYSVARRVVYGFEKGGFDAARILPIPVEHGQALNRIVLEFDLPGLTAATPDQDVRYTPHIATVLIESVALLIDEERISEQTGVFMTLYSDQMQDKLYGDRQFLDRQEQGLTTYAPRIEGSTVFVPLNFWFCEDVRSSLPLFMLRGKVQLAIRFRPFSEVWQTRRYEGGGGAFTSKIKRTLPGDPPVPDRQDWRIAAHCDYLLLSEANQTWFRRRNPFLIQTTESRVVPLESGRGGVSLNLEEFTNPCQKILWYLQSEDNIRLNDWFNFSTKTDFDGIVSPVALVDPTVESPGPPLSIEVSDRVIDNPPQPSLEVTLGPKTVANPGYGIGFDSAVYVGGVEAPELHLPRGGAYTFTGDAAALLTITNADGSAFEGFSGGVLTVAENATATLRYSAAGHDGSLIHTGAQKPTSVVAPTEESMAVDEGLVSDKSTSYTWPYGTHQLTVFEGSTVREVQMPDATIRNYTSVQDWLALFVANARDSSLAPDQFAHWDSIDAMVTLGRGIDGTMAVRDGSALYTVEPQTPEDYFGYALGLAYLFRGRECIRLDLKHYFAPADLDLATTSPSSVTREGDKLQVRFWPSATTSDITQLRTGITVVDEVIEAILAQPGGEESFEVSLIAVSGQEFDNITYSRVDGEASAWSAFSGLYLKGRLVVTSKPLEPVGYPPTLPDPEVEAVYMEIETSVPLEYPLLSPMDGGSLVTVASAAELTIARVAYPDAPPETLAGLAIEGYVAGTEGTYTLSGVSGGVAILDLVGSVQGSPAAQLTLQVPTADAMDDPTQVRLVVRNDTLLVKALVAAHGPPRPIAEEFPAWPVPEWSRVDSAVYYTGERGVSDPGSYLMLTCGDRAVRGRLSMADLSWSFDTVPQPGDEPLVVNVMKTKEINLGIIPTVRGDTQRQTTNSLDAAMSSGDLQGGELLPSSRQSIFVMIGGQWRLRGALQLVRGFRYRFVPVDFDSEVTFSDLNRFEGGGGTLLTKRLVDGQQAVTDLAKSVRLQDAHADAYPEIRLTSVEQQGTTYKYTFTGELPGTTTVGFLRGAGQGHTRWDAASWEGPGGAESGLHLYVSQDFGSVYPMQRSASDAVVTVEDPTVVQLHYDVDPQSRAVSSYGSYVSVRGSTGSGYEFKVEEMFADYEGGGSIRTIMDKGATLTQVTAAGETDNNSGYSLIGGTTPCLWTDYPADTELHTHDEVAGMRAVRVLEGGLHRRAWCDLGGFAEVPPVDTVPPTVVPGKVYFLRQSPGRPTLHLPGAALYVGEEPADDAEAYAGASGVRYLVWTAVLPSSWHLGESGPANQLARLEGAADVQVPNTALPHGLLNRSVDSAVVMPRFFDGRHRCYVFRGLYCFSVDYQTLNAEEGIWVGAASQPQQIGAVFPQLQTDLHSLGLPQRVRAVSYGMDQSFSVVQFAPGTEVLWGDSDTSDRVTMLAQDRTSDVSAVQNKLQHLTYRVAASTRNWRQLEVALNRNVQVMERNHAESWAMFASTNGYLNGAVADLWQEIAEQSERLGQVERRRNPYPHVYDAEREKWYVQRPDDVHMLREARLLRAPTQEVVPWQSWKYFHHLQNYLDGSYLSHQVYSFVFSTRALGGVADGGDARDAEDFKSAKLSLELRLNPRNPASRLFVYLQTFQTLQVREDGRVTKACEYRDGKWHCGNGDAQRPKDKQTATPSRNRVSEPASRREFRSRVEDDRRIEDRHWVEVHPPPLVPVRAEPVPRFLQDDRAKAQTRLEAFTERYNRGSADAVRSMWQRK